MNIKPIQYKNTVVAPTSVLSDFLGTKQTNIKTNHSGNKDKFVEGKHFFRVSHTDSKALILDYNGKHGTILWTERGCARHSKLLQTQEAWDLWEDMEDTYFNKKELTPAEQVLQQAQLLVDHERKIRELEHQQTETACQVKALVEGENYFTVVGYANLTKLKVDEALSRSLGKKASKICRDNQWNKGETNHPHYGVCGTYPREALEQAFSETLGIS